MPELPFKRISVIGLGYIGLPTAAMFASRKVEVVGVDVNQHAVDTINRGEVHIVEPDLDILVRAVVSEGYLRATTVPEPAEAFLIAVPTPFTGKEHAPDLSYLRDAIVSIATVLEPGNLIIVESTTPVGTSEKVASWLAAARPDLTFPQHTGEASDIRIAHCPERVMPGKVMQELVTNSRVIGGMTSACSEQAKTLYEIFVTGECMLASSTSVAEMVKLTENSYRDVNIAFANELSIICELQKIDVWELIRLANHHPRVNVLRPGPGVGGHCIAVDPWFIINSAPQHARLIRSARDVNDGKPEWVLDRVASSVASLYAQSKYSKRAPITVACYGLAYKADTDDLRESPALEIVRKLVGTRGLRVLAVEPNICALPLALSGAELVDYSMATTTADIHLLLVDHSSFRHRRPEGGHIIDTCGIWTPVETSARGTP